MVRMRGLICDHYPEGSKCEIKLLRLFYQLMYESQVRYEEDYSDDDDYDSDEFR
jgi:hypothetical protein